MQLVSSPRQTARGPAATRTLAAQGAGYKNDPKRGSRRHLSPRDPPILTPRTILRQLWGVRTHLEPFPLAQIAKKGQKRVQKSPNWLQKGVETPLGPSRPANFDSPPHVTPTIGGPDPLGAVAPHPNDQKGSKRAQKGPEWLKITKNGPKGGSRRHLGPRDPPILTPRPILPQLGGPDPLGAVAPTQMAKKGQKRPKRAQNGSKWPKMAPKGGPDATRDRPILIGRSFYP